MTRGLALGLVVCCLLSGCVGVLPAASPPGSNAVPPQVTCDWTLDRAEGAATVRIDRGVTITAGNTHSLWIYGPEQGDVVWAGPAEFDTRSTFPIEPGESLTVGVSEPDPDLNLVWEGGDDLSVTLCAEDFPPPTEGGGV